MSFNIYQSMSFCPLSALSVSHTQLFTLPSISIFYSIPAFIFVSIHQSLFMHVLSWVWESSISVLFFVCLKSYDLNDSFNKMLYLNYWEHSMFMVCLALSVSILLRKECAVFCLISYLPRHGMKSDIATD